MALPIISADQRLSEKRCAKVALVGVPGAGKTSQIRTLDAERTLLVDTEAGDLSILDWAGDTLRPQHSLVETRPTGKRPDVGLVHTLWEMFNQNGDKVLLMDGWGMFRRRTPAA